MRATSSLDVEGVYLSGVFASAQFSQFEDHCRTDDLGTEIAYEGLGRCERPAGGEDVIDEEDALALLQDIGAFDGGGAVFECVGRGSSWSGELAGLADRQNSDPRQC